MDKFVAAQQHAEEKYLELDLASQIYCKSEQNSSMYVTIGESVHTQQTNLVRHYHQRDPLLAYLDCQVVVAVGCWVLLTIAGQTHPHGPHR